MRESLQSSQALFGSVTLHLSPDLLKDARLKSLLLVTRHILTIDCRPDHPGRSDTLRPLVLRKAESALQLSAQTLRSKLRIAALRLQV